MRYTILTAGAEPVAGLMALAAEAGEAGSRPGWIGYIAVGDVDAAAARLADAGGTVRRPAADIPGVGRFAMVADPHGAPFALFTPTPSGAAARETAQPGAPGSIGWHELRTSWTSAFGFYTGQFGWTKADALDMGPIGAYRLFAAGGDPIGGMMTDADASASPVWLFHFNVDRIDAAVVRIATNGGRIRRGPHEVPGGGWIVHAIDPQGALFALMAPRR